MSKFIKRTNAESAAKGYIKVEQPKPVKEAPRGEKAPTPKSIDGHGKECGGMSGSYGNGMNNSSSGY